MDGLTSSMYFQDREFNDAYACAGCRSKNCTWWHEKLYNILELSSVTTSTNNKDLQVVVVLKSRKRVVVAVAVAAAVVITAAAAAVVA